MASAAEYTSLTLKRVRLPIASAAAIVFVTRVLTLPASFWQGEEIRFARALLTFDPLQQQPEPPGYPLYIALGRLLNFLIRDPFVALVSLSVIAATAGAYLLALAVADLLGDDRLGAAAAIVLYFSPAMLAFDALPNPEALTAALIAAAWLALIHERPIWFGIAAAAVVAVRPEIAFAMLIVVLLRPRSLVAFVVVAMVAFIPLVEAIGIRDLFSYVKTNYVALRLSSAATGAHGRELVLRFIAHPWGAKWMSFPILIVAAAGFTMRRSKPTMLIGVFAVAHLVFCFAFADRADGVQPVLPASIVIAIFVALAFAAWPRFALIAAALYAVAGVTYTWPLVNERKTLSPPARAMRFVRRYVPRDSVLLYEPSMEAWAKLSRLNTAPVRDFDRFIDRPGTPLFLLADGGSRVPRATKFEWPDSDAYGKITTERYRVTSIIPFPPNTRYRVLRGVYSFERTTSGREWRWLEQDAEIELPQLGKGVVQVRLALPEDAPIASTDITINGVPVVVKRGEEVTVAVTSTGILRIHAARTFSSDRDRRPLAVQLIAIEQR